MISVLIPTRGRPESLSRTVESAREKAKNKPEFVVYIDEDDHESIPAAQKLGISYRIGSRTVLSECWNRAFELSIGDILMQGNDDIIFKTQNWDVMVEEAFSLCSDRILMVHGTDGSDLPSGLGEFGPHPFIHRRWVETVGYFTPPYFSSDYGDTWLNDVANALGRRRCLPFVVEHMHYLFGKSEFDQTYKDRLERHGRDKVDELYRNCAPKREADVAKLKMVISGELFSPSTKKWTIMILTQPSRAAFLERLLSVLRPQVEPFKEQIEIAIRIFDRTLSIGENRQKMVEKASGSYVNFVDDDDLVPDNYVSSIFPLLDGVDQIGFRVQTFIDGVKTDPTYHSLKYKDWSADSGGYYRDISHANPILRHLALQVSFSGGPGEDSRWSDGMRAKGIVRTEHYIDEVMYLYYYRSNKPDANGVIPLPQQKASDFLTVNYCPQCNATVTVLFSNGRRCNQCGLQY